MSKISQFIIKSKIRFKTYDGEYEGIVKSVSYPMKRITLDCVESLPYRKKLGSMTLFNHEISSYKILELLDSQNKFNNNLSKQFIDLPLDKSNSHLKDKDKEMHKTLKKTNFQNDSKDILNEYKRLLPEEKLKMQTRLNKNILRTVNTFQTSENEMHVRCSQKLLSDSNIKKLFLKRNGVAETVSNYRDARCNVILDHSKKSTSQSDKKICYVPSGMDC